jgi:hypothetical protein
MPTVTATVVLEAELAGSGAGWTDLSADTRIASQALSLTYGISGNSPIDRVAQSGTLVWSMNNAASNSGGVLGYYSPGHTNARSGWDLGIIVRLKITYGGTTYYKFRGTLVDVQPQAGQYRNRSVDCSAVDWMDEAARSKITGIAIQENQRSDQLVSTIVTNSVARQPAATSYATGQSTFAISLDNLSDNQTSVMAALSDVVASELGYLYVKGDTTQGGTLVFEDRHARPKAGAAVHTFNNSMIELEVLRSRDDIINRVFVVVHPRTVSGSSGVLYEMTTTESVPKVLAGTTLKITALYKEPSINAYRVAGKTLVTPVAGTDWIANTAADGGGSVITSDTTLTFGTTGANAVELVITNTGTVDAYITTLQVRGTQVADTSEVVMASSDTSSQTTYGEVDTRIDMPYESDVTLAASISKWILGVYKDPRYVLNGLTVVGSASSALMTQCLAREPGDKIAVVETVSGITDSEGAAEVGYFINGVELTIDAGNILTAAWALSPADASAFWILQTVGASELGVTTVLGFA